MTHNQAIDTKQPDCDGELLSAGRDDSDPAGIARKFRCTKCGAYLFGLRGVVRGIPVGTNLVEALVNQLAPRKTEADRMLADLARNFRLPPR